MRTQFYQVVGAGAFTVDYPTGQAIAHRSRQTFEAHPTNKSVVRGLRTNRLRALSKREADAVRSHAAARAKLAEEAKKTKAQKVAAPPKPKPKPKAGKEPIVALPDNK